MWTVADLQPGSEFAAYRIERRLGVGGMGVVYEAVETALDRRVALKLIAPAAGRDPSFRERFAAESRIAAQVEHPNVIPIYAVGEHEGVPFIAMRLVSGPDLGSKIAALRHLEPADAATIVAKAATGLDAIHAAGLIHRDVKPGNILLAGPESREDVYVTDFGIARNAAETSELTPGGHVLGTLDYVSPEQVQGDPVDARTDVYALGCVLFKALTGETPFPHDDGVATLWAHVHEDPPLPSATAGVPRAFDPVVARALAKRPADRYPSAGDLGHAARAAAEERPTTRPETAVAAGPAAGAGRQDEGEAPTRKLARAGPAGPPRRFGEAGRRNRRTAALGLLIGVVVAAGASFFLLDSGDEGTDAAERLAERADAICAQSRREYVRIASERPSDREEALAQADGLVRVTRRSLEQLRSLRPPPEIADQYRKYLAQRQLMLYQLRDAHEAITRGDLDAFRTSFARIEAQQPLRYESAREIGLTQCSRGR